MPTTIRRMFARAFSVLVALVFATTLFSVSPGAGTAAAAPAATTQTSTKSTTQTTSKPAAKRRAFGARVVAKAATRRGMPYSYGANGPTRFDCSGLTQWTFKKLNRRLPHSSAAQYGRTKHIGKKARRRGDLVFFHNSGRIYHVGIYAGKNQIWHAPYSGTRVRKERIWSSNVYYGRVR